MRAFSQLSETFIYDSLRALDRLGGIEQHVACSVRENRESRPFNRVDVWSELPWYDARDAWERIHRQLETPKDRLPRMASARAHLSRLTSRLKPDVIHAHFGHFGVVASPVSISSGVPLVVSLYGHDISRLPLRRSWRRAYHQLWRVAARVCVLSEDMRSTALSLHCRPDRAAVQHLGRQLREIEYTPKSGPIRRLLSIGRLVEKKGHLDLIEAIATDELSDMSLDIIGDGPLMPTLARAIEKRSVTSRVRLLGSRPNHETLNFIRRCDAFALTSRTASDGDQEGTPTVLVEAQALGRPVVSTRHAGIPEMVPIEHHRFLVREGDIAGIRRSIRELRACSAQEISELVLRGRKKMEREFDADDLAGQLHCVYEEAISRR